MTDEQLKACWEILPYATSETTKAMGEALNRFAESFIDVWQEIGKQLASFISAITPALNNLAQYLNNQAELEKCPNRKIVHLAKHARKARIRKKNLHRAIRIIEKEAKK